MLAKEINEMIETARAEGYAAGVAAEREREIEVLPISLNPLMRAVANLYNVYHGENPDKVSEQLQNLMEVYDGLLD